MSTNSIHPDVIFWLAKHGSAQLKQGRDLGYSMIPLIYIEYARAIYPSFCLDLEHKAKWERAECPSLAAMHLVESLKNDFIEGYNIAFATLHPVGYNGTSAVYADIPAECVIVRDSRIPYDLFAVVR